MPGEILWVLVNVSREGRMSQKPNMSGPEFEPGQIPWPIDNISVRDYFAGQALSRLAETDFYHAKEVTEICYKYADLMLEWRDK